MSAAATTQPAPIPILRRGGARPFPPRVSGFTRPFWEALAAGRLITTACTACGRLSFPPKPLCRACWSEAVTWKRLVPRGRLYSFTHVHVLPGAFAADGLADIGIVDLEDGVRLMCRLLGERAQHRCEARIEMVVLAYADGPLFAARPIV